MKLPRIQLRLRTLFVILAIVAVQCAACLPALKEWQRLQRNDAIRKTIRWPGGYPVRRVTIPSEKIDVQL
jgi:hypothetical protein